MTEQELILSLCTEAGDDVSDPASVEEGFRSNHRPELIAAAAKGNAAALMELRILCGLHAI